MSYPVGRSFVLALTLFLFTSVAFAVLGWLWQTDVGLSWPSLLLCVAAWLGSLSWAWCTWWFSLSGWLTWDPDPEAAGYTGGASGTFRPLSGWWWSSSEGAQGIEIRQLKPIMVFRSWMLLRMEYGRGFVPAHWLWVESRTLPLRWIALRRAVLAHAC